MIVAGNTRLTKAALRRFGRRALLLVDGVVAGLADRLDVLARTLHGVAGRGGKYDAACDERENEFLDHGLVPFLRLPGHATGIVGGNSRSGLRFPRRFR